MGSSMGLSSDSMMMSNDLQLFNYCSQQNNITIVVDTFFVSHFEKFYILMKELIGNEDCYLVNIYLPDEDRVVRLTRNTSVNRIHRSFKFPFKVDWRVARSIHTRSNHFDSISNWKLDKFIEILYKEQIIGNKFTRQTFLLMTSYLRDSYSLRPLSQLQNKRSWKVIIYWLSKGDVGVNPYIRGSIKMPLHRLMLPNYEHYSDLSLKNLIDVVKEPNFSRYGYYRSVPFEKHFFNETCLSGITKLLITVSYLNDLYLPMALAIIYKENEHRKKSNIEPLKIIFYSYDFVPEILLNNLRLYDRNIEIKRWYQHPLMYEAISNEKRKTYTSLINQKSYCSWANVQSISIQKKAFSYRNPSNPIGKCFKDKRFKTFQTPDEFYEQLNTDLCK